MWQILLVWQGLRRESNQAFGSDKRRNKKEKKLEREEIRKRRN